MAERRKIPMLRPTVALLGDNVQRIGRPPRRQGETQDDPERTQAGQWSHLYAHRRWRRIRLEQLTKHPICAFCERDGRIRLATICDHVEPHRGDMKLFWHGARQSLCKPCHDREKQRQEKSGG